MIALSESSPQLGNSATAIDLFKSTEAAKLAGFRVYYIPQDFSECGTAENAIWHIPEQENMSIGIWIGYIPSPDHYNQLYHAALSKNIQIVNSPNQFRIAMEFDKYYPSIESLTFRSAVFGSLERIHDSSIELEYPLFVKGAIQSLKAKGIDSCVANNKEELLSISNDLLSQTSRSLGRIIVREFKPLKHHRKTGLGFPMGREFRVFMHRSEVLEYGYYWEGRDELSELSEEEEGVINALCNQVSQNVDVPYLALDVGQLENDEWIVIELGDAQFSGIGQIPLNRLWNNLSKIET